jgi:hypothetical protein
MTKKSSADKCSRALRMAGSASNVVPISDNSTNRIRRAFRGDPARSQLRTRTSNRDGAKRNARQSVDATYGVDIHRNAPAWFDAWLATKRLRQAEAFKKQKYQASSPALCSCITP